MTIERIPITSREQWLALRKQDVTASSVAAIFNCHPYQSAYALFAEKSGLEVPDASNAMLEWRLILESAVAAAVERQKPEWKVIKATDYLRDPDARIGATLDFYIEGDPRGLGVLQAKTAAPGSFRKYWDDNTPPFWIALQNTTELMLEPKAVFGAVACLIIDPWECNCPIYEIPRHEGAEARIREGVAKFWDDVEYGREPDPDYAKDAQLIAALNAGVTVSKTVDLSADNYLPAVLAERLTLKDTIKTSETRVKEIDAEVLHKMGDAEVATLLGFTITNKQVNRKGYEVKPTSYRQMRVTDNRPKQEVTDDTAA